MPIIVGAIAYALVATFALQGGATNRLTNSDDAQSVASMYEKDVQSATRITTVNDSQDQCGTSGTQLLGLQWSAGGATDYVSYQEVGTSTPYNLVRNYCSGSTVPTSSNTLSFNLPSGQLPPTYACAADCTADVGGWVSATGVSNVTFAISEVGATTHVGDFAYTLIATPGIYLAQLDGSAGGGSPIYPLALLGQPNCGAGASPTLSMTGASTVTAVSSSGGLLPIYVASSCADAITMIPGQSLTGTVASIITNDPNTTTPGQDTYCVLTNKNGTTCNPAQAGPTESAPTTSVVDPLAGLTPPSNPTLPAGCLDKACSQGEEFSTTKAISGNFGVAGDTYIFDANVTISGNVSVNFAPGTYWFKDGLTMAASSVYFGSGTYLFGSPGTDNCPSATCLAKTNGGTITTDSTNGVLFYVENGAATFNGSNQIAISAASSGYPLNTLYGEVALWDISTSPLSITNGASAADSFSGIYDPNGEVVLSGSGALNISFVEANSASLTGSGSLTLGQ